MTLPATNEYLRFQRVQDSPSGKTQVWLVMTYYGDPLGVIRWFVRWRQYAFEPEANRVFNPGCLDTISANAAYLTKQHRVPR